MGSLIGPIVFPQKWPAVERVAQSKNQCSTVVWPPFWIAHLILLKAALPTVTGLEPAIP